MSLNEANPGSVVYCYPNRHTFEDVIQPEELCYACQQPALNPHTAICGHTYCGHYVDSLKRENVSEIRCLGADEDSPDEQCQEKILVPNLSIDKALDRFINNKRIKCSNHHLGCAEVFKLRRLPNHLSTDCQFATIRCPNCKREHQRGKLEEHHAGCRSKACAYADIGCEYVSEPDERAAASSLSSKTPEHGVGLHLALLFQLAASLRSAAEFSAKTLQTAMTRHSPSVPRQEQTLSMLAHPDQQNTEAVGIQEYPSVVAEPGLRSPANHFGMEVQQPSGRNSKRGAAAPDDDSDLSDDMEWLNEKKVKLDVMNMKVRRCHKERIRQLYNSEKVYTMSSPIRGSCLIINNSKFELDLPDRPGSEMDVQNISTVFKRLKFNCDIRRNFSAQKMIDAITAETRNEENENYGMFVLVIMTHGTETNLYGSDGRPFERKKIFDLLNAYRFSAMAGKPKLIILQACSGDSAFCNHAQGQSAPMEDNTWDGPGKHGEDEGRRQERMPSATDGASTSANASAKKYLPSDDFFIMKASVLGSASICHDRHGSWFIRALVEALYKHACHRDIQTLFEKQVRKKVRFKSLLGNSSQQASQDCFPTEDRELYLFPDYNP